MTLIIGEKLPVNFCQLIKIELDHKNINRLSDEFGLEYKEVKSILNRELKLTKQNFNLVTKLVREALKERKQRFPKDV